eukprot:CAMPEP_0117496148 /NCGR_PEP_ID=MMETSP0784-20121206/20503_1 /TAXON_ID=39447 /ORGANISM="" /LENGTH=691 /DNA_ID=CAMNT_0005291101 /DNA_START=1 /DNA_END=2077 /DNA_ORIENTATION=+
MWMAQPQTQDASTGWWSAGGWDAAASNNAWSAQDPWAAARTEAAASPVAETARTVEQVHGQAPAAEDSWGGGWEKAADPPPAAENTSSSRWTNGAQASPVAGTATDTDAWRADVAATTDGGWGKEAWDAAATAGDSWNQPPPANEFWETQAWYKEQGKLSHKEEWELERDDVSLFMQRLGSSAGLDFSRYENVPVDVSGEKATCIPVCKSFEELYEMFSECMTDALVQNVRRCMYKLPTPVQKYAIPVGLVGRDVMCCAQTGSGKTAAFLIPVLGRMMKLHEAPVGQLTIPYEGPCAPDTLIIAPTRELSIQIHEEAMKFCHRTDYYAAVVYGGAKPRDQLIEIAKGADVIVATPGRLQDFINRGVITMTSVHILVLDEADRILDMGFEPQIREIVEKHGMKSKEERQTMMFSATFPENCQKLAQEYLYNYIWIGVGIVGGATDTVEQELVKVMPKDKFAKLTETLDKFFETRDSISDHQERKPRALVFTNAKDTAKFLDEQLYEMKIDTGALHGNLTQLEREQNLNRFRAGQIDVMIATDVASRGLDIENVALVVNYDMPAEIDSYIHRIGRTGRIGNTGKALTFISCDEYDCCLENVAVLKNLSRVMTDSRSTMPDWLDSLIETTTASKLGGSSSWNWGGKDVRGGNEAYCGTGGGDAWADWQKKQGGDAGATWGTSAWEEKKEEKWTW